MKIIASRITQVLLLVGLGVVAFAHAYQEGGHYYTLLALFDSKVNAASEERSREIRLEAFCAELPDLARELDAISQRMRVIYSSKDNLWAARSSCQTSVSSHMVASQYYLHGLSAAPATQLRAAANDLILAIDSDLGKANLAKDTRRNLLCARGFAAHLYGDSFAHVKLPFWKFSFLAKGDQTEMYDTGIGHLRDGSGPDYLYGHKSEINMWPRWVLDASNYVVKSAHTKRVLDTHVDIQGGKIGDNEEPARKRLEDLLQMKAKIMVSDMQNMLAEGTTGIDGMERATSCDTVVARVFPDVNDRPQCSDAWRIYLEKAVPVFYNQGIDPTSRSNAGADTSCSAWRCSDKSTYGRESPSSCVVKIVDELRFGME